jgi:hypothetical protein
MTVRTVERPTAEQRAPAEIRWIAGVPESGRKPLTTFLVNIDVDIDYTVFLWYIAATTAAATAATADLSFNHPKGSARRSNQGGGSGKKKQANHHITE